MKNSFLYIFIFFFAALSLSAQNAGDSLNFLSSNFRQKILNSNFEKQLNIYNLNSSLIYGYDFNRLFIGLNTKFNSTLTGTTEKNIKDEQFHSILGEYAAAPQLSIGALIKYNAYSDDRQLGINQAANTSSSLFLKYSPIEKLQLIPFGGFLMNKQIGEEDNGSLYGGEAILDDLELSDLNFNATAKFINEDISPRKNTLRMLNTALSNFITPELNNDFRLHYSEARKDFYFQSDSSTANEFDIVNNIQSRNELNYFLQDRLFYVQPKSGIVFDLNGRVGWRDIDRHTRYVSLSNISASSFDTKVEEFRIDLSSSAEYRSKFLTSRLKIEFAEKEEKYKTKPIDGAAAIFFDERQRVESRKNNSSKLTTLSLTNTINLSPSDILLVALLHRKLVYDTPSLENYDDRDELLSTFQIIYSRKHTPFLDLFLTLEGSINHMVYIFAERSSNNNIKRVLKLSGGGIYHGSIITSSNRAEVSANYTVYDFEDLTPNIQSFSFRQFALWDSSSVKMNNRVSLDFQGYLKLSDQGDFLWSEFSSRPVRYLNEMFLLPKLSFLFKRIKFSCGIRYFDLKTFTYNSGGTKQLSTEYKSVGPISEINYNLTGRLQFSFLGWYEFITTEDNSKRELANLSIRLGWNM